MPKFDTGSFDVVFSNSVIEYVGAFSDQERMASEVLRVGKRYYVQTPNRFFPIEPHFLLPGFQFLPRWMKVAMIQRFALGWYDRAATREEACCLADEIRLLRRGELRRLFPGGKIMEERF
jgi:SAM-dependent methyltransferase